MKAAWGGRAGVLWPVPAPHQRGLPTSAASLVRASVICREFACDYDPMPALAAGSAAERQGEQLRVAVARFEQHLEIEHRAVAAMDAVGRDLVRLIEVAANGGQAVKG